MTVSHKYVLLNFFNLELKSKYFNSVKTKLFLVTFKILVKLFIKNCLIFETIIDENYLKYLITPKIKNIKLARIILTNFDIIL